MRFLALILSIVAIGLVGVPSLLADESREFVVAQAVPSAGPPARSLAGLLAGNVRQLPPVGGQANAGRDHCISYLTRNGAFWGNPNDISWQPQNSVWLCENNQDLASPPEPVRCFTSQMAVLNNWQQAIGTCRVARGLAFGAPGQSGQPQSAGQEGALPLAAVAGVIGSPNAVAPNVGVPGANVTVLLRNGLAQPVDIYFIDASGEGVFLHEIATGAAMSVGSRNGAELVFALDGSEFSNYLTGPAAQQSFAISTASSAPGSSATTAQPVSPASPEIESGALVQGPLIPGPLPAPSGALPQGGASGGFVPGKPKIISNNGQQTSPPVAGPPIPGLGLVLDKVEQGFVRTEKVIAECAATRLVAEQTICNHDELTALQVAINSSYEFINGSLTPLERNRLIVDHQSWIASRNACGADVSCLQNNLFDRSGYLSEYFHTGD